MLKVLIILLLILTFTLSASAQVDTAWVRRFNVAGNYDKQVLAMTVDGSGNVYVTGTPGTIKYDPYGNQLWRDSQVGKGIVVDGEGNIYITGSTKGRGIEDIDYIIIRYYPNGDTAWVRRYGTVGRDYANSIALDPSGNVYVTGMSMAYYATLKYNPNGRRVWLRDYDGSGRGENGASSLTTDIYGSVYVTGYSYKSGTYFDYATIKYDSAGNEIWVKRFNGPANGYDYALDLAVDNLGNVYVTGFCDSENGECCDQKITGKAPDYATIKYYPNGDTAWIRVYNGPGNGDDRAYGIDVDNSGNVYVTGVSWDSVTSNDYATIKYYPNGDIAWIRRYNGVGNSSDWASDITLDGFGSIYVTGESNGDYVTIKYNSIGDVLWVEKYEGPGNGVDRAIDIAVDASGNVYVTGWSNGGVTGKDYATIKYYQQDETKNWKTYKDEEYGFGIKYPEELLALSQKDDKIFLIHSIPYEHQDPCDFKGGAPPLKELTDFKISLRVFDKNLKETIIATMGEYFGSNILIKDTLKLEAGYIDKVNIGSFNGYRIANGVEGCGYYAYYLPLSLDYTLLVERTYITEFLPVIKDYQKYMELPGIISPDEEERLFNQVISTFEFLK